MRRFLLSILSLLLAAITVTSVSAQSADEQQAFVKVEKMPSFRGGNLTTFRNWVMSQVRYPEVAQKKSIQGRVLAQFVVEKDGSITEIQILQSPDKSLSEEVIRVLKASPNWIPGSHEGKSVRVKYTLPVEFKIQGGEQQLKVGDVVKVKETEGVIVGFFDKGHKHGLLISVKSIQGDWKVANEWCKSLGDGWRLPEADELKYLNELTKDGKKLTFKQLAKLYKSSCWACNGHDADTAVFVDMKNNSVGRAPKSKKLTVYAVALF